MPHQPTLAQLACPHCPRKFTGEGRRVQHMNTYHRQLTPPADEGNRAEDHSFTYIRHPVLSGNPCNEDGEDLLPHSPPAPEELLTPEGSWRPFESRSVFDWAYLTFSEAKMSERLTNKFLKVWAASLLENGGGKTPWGNAKEFWATIDEVQHGSCPWKTYVVQYEGPLPASPPKWMTEEFHLCTQNSRTLLHEQVRNSKLKNNAHYTAYRQFNSQQERVFSNVMSADWVWDQSNRIAEDHSNEAPGAMFLPIIAGSDKTTVSVATGHQVFHPVYQSPGIISNIARRAHGNGVLPVAFLPIPKVSRNESKTNEYATFCRQLYHSCLAKIFQPLKAGMTKPELVRCPDGHLRRAFYGLGPYIADYPEQVYLAGVVSGWCPKCDAPNNALDLDEGLRRSHMKNDLLKTLFDEDILWEDYGVRCDYKPFTYEFPRADIHEQLTPDLLHQVIKGTFKDHIVTWVYEYLVLTHGVARANEIQEDIDRRLSVVPPYPGLRRFPEGRNFEQWTGNDSKALMKIYLACIVGHVPSQMVQCLSAFLDFCYIARQNLLSSSDLNKLKDALQRFHQYRDVFIEAGVRDDISLPRQHSLVHYARMIRLFGSPNGLCSSITESKHIVAVKKPWRSSSRYHALAQILRRISREEKLEAALQDFTRQGMMVGDALSYTEMVLDGGQPIPLEAIKEEEDEGDDLGPTDGPKVLSSIKLSITPAQGYPRDLESLAVHISQLLFPTTFRRFLWSEIHPDNVNQAHTIPVDQCPLFSGRISVHHSAIAYFYAPSDVCGAGGMYHERIRSTPLWQKSYPRRDTVFVETDHVRPGMLGMTIARVFLFFSFTFLRQSYSCAFVHWIERDGDEVDPETGLWVVRPEFIGNQRSMAVIDLDCIARGAHLLPVFGPAPLPATLHFSQSLDIFRAFFVNRFIDHHSHEFVL
ncbi:hypothetical protein CPB83DRAFT_767174 [Crepidotus variabilis]|uniref:C2H2-type domain-containing protein n=1 Tax=Crepidotus variabilis TaxID=179855 RepID=A0A9P6EG04_9AGAR|nr:hypothetical protein CPB83DRAFT_767174 [Crepidotus variabilis]